MLNTLQFKLSVPTPYVFMKRFLKAAQSDEEVRSSKTNQSNIKTTTNKQTELTFSMSFFFFKNCIAGAAVVLPDGALSFGKCNGEV